MKKLFDQLFNENKKIFLDFPWDQQAHLAHWSAQTYYYTRHITRVMSLCAGATNLESEKLHKFFLGHLGEEMGHHLVALKDVSALGENIDNIPENPATRLLYETQYYKALSNPVSFYGFGLMLEWLSLELGPPVYQKIKAKGLESFFLKLHIKDDESHAPAVDKLLANCTDGENRAIFQNCSQTFLAYRLFLADIEKVVAKSLNEDHRLESAA